jgi:hypothetical protein
MRTVVVIMLGNFMSALDSSIVNSTMNEMSREFNSSLALIQWISAGYMLALTVTGLIAGWIAERLGAKRIYMGSLALFAAGSALSGVAWSAESIVVLRIIQGLSSGMLVPTGISILARGRAAEDRVGDVRAWRVRALRHDCRSDCRRLTCRSLLLAHHLRPEPALGTGDPCSCRRLPGGGKTQGLRWTGLEGLSAPFLRNGYTGL